MSEKDKKSLLGSTKFVEFIKSNKNVQIAVVLLAFAIILVIFISSFTSTSTTTSETSLTFEYVENLEKRLENIITSIQGAGSVNVMITLENGSEYKFASEDEEKFFSSLEEAQSELGSNGQIVIKEVYPKVKGAVVVCSGASDVAVKLNVLKAIQALLSISSGNIEILTGN
ncbi:MAG: hypothetical protein WCR30_00465 [Clostridia bacterium]